MAVGVDLAGECFGRLIPLRYFRRSLVIRGEDRGRRMWVCICECGRLTAVPTQKLISGATKSCGCFNIDRIREVGHRNKVHGGHGSREYQTWRSMINRCENPNAKNFKYWGGRGISVCARWRHGEEGLPGFACFLADMGARPSSDLSIDRYPNPDGNYEPGNCRWATRTEQNRNTSKRHIMEDGHAKE